MRDHSQGQVFTVFGGAYVAEHHEISLLPRSEGGSRTSRKIAAERAS